MSNPEPAPESIQTSSDFTAWSREYTTAQTPKPKAPEMIEALEFLLVREQSYACATAQLNGGAFDLQRLRRIAALEAARDTMIRMRDNFSDFPDKVKKAIVGAK